MVSSTTGLPFILPDGAELFFNPPSLRGIHRATIEYIEGGFPDARVKLQGVDSIDDVADLVGKTVLVHREDYAEGEAPEDPIGREVCCIERGPLGTIDGAFSAGTANRVWTVNGPYGEILIPVIDRIVLDIPDDVAESISVHLPYGLIDAEAIEVDGPDSDPGISEGLDDIQTDAEDGPAEGAGASRASAEGRGR